MNAVGLVAAVIFALALFAAAICMFLLYFRLAILIIPSLRKRASRPGLQALLTYFVFAAFVAVGMLSAVVGVWLGHWHLNH